MLLFVVGDFRVLYFRDGVQASIQSLNFQVLAELLSKLASCPNLLVDKASLLSYGLIYSCQMCLEVCVYIDQVVLSYSLRISLCRKHFYSSTGCISTISTILD